MGLSVWLEIIKGVLEFPEHVLAIIKVVRKTPAAKRSELLVAMNKNIETTAQTGRPTW